MPAAPAAVELAMVAAQAAADKLATDVTVLDVADRLAITDTFVLTSAPNERQVSSIVDEIELRMREAGVEAGAARRRARGTLGAARLR